MASDQLRKLNEKGQVVWYDNLSREELQNGSLQSLIEQGVSGLTSNPTIFEKAIGSSATYDEAIRAALAEEKDLETICEDLCVQDVAEAARLLRPVWESSGGADGYASLEVSPELAYDTEGTLEAARRLWKKLGASNCMIKVPATAEGVLAVRELLKEGINVNVTLIFSTRRYEEVAQSYVEAMTWRKEQGLPVDNIASVASFFVSRLDSLVSEKLEALGHEASLFVGRIAVANCRLAYSIFEKLFRDEKFVALGANVQKPLWASTSTKTDALEPVFYVQELVAPDTVNTMPPVTLAATMEGVEPKDLTALPVDKAQSCVDDLIALGVALDKVFFELTEQGVNKFIASYRSLLGELGAKCSVLSGE